LPVLERDPTSAGLDHVGGPDLGGNPANDLDGLREIRLGAGEGEVGGPAGGDVLNNHVHRYARRAQRLEDGGGYSGPVRDAKHSDLGDVLLMDDSSHPLPIFHSHLGDDHRTRAPVERRAHVDGDAVELADLDRARVHHLGADGGEFQDLLVGDLRQQGRVSHHPRVG